MSTYRHTVLRRLRMGETEDCRDSKSVHEGELFGCIDEGFGMSTSQPALQRDDGVQWPDILAVLNRQIRFGLSEIFGILVYTIFSPIFFDLYIVHSKKQSLIRVRVGERTPM